MRIRQIVGALAGVAVAMAAGVACAPKKSAPYPDVESFCNAKAQAECQIATTCLIEATDCEAERASLCNADATSATASGTRDYTQGNAQACIDALDAVYGNGATKVSFAQLEGMGSVSDICERVFSGNAGMNEPCQSSYDCTGDNICASVTPGVSSGDGGAGPYVCAPPGAPIAEGQFCTTPGSTCVTDSYCAVKPGSAATCVPAMQENQPCNTVTAPCVSAQRCESQAGVTGQTCEPRVALGQPCQTSDDCAPAAPYCDPYVGNLCTPGLSFAAGAPDCKAFESGDAGVSVAAVDAGGE